MERPAVFGLFPIKLYRAYNLVQSSKQLVRWEVSVDSSLIK